jgi:uncharacterized protein DUF4136
MGMKTSTKKYFKLQLRLTASLLIVLFSSNLIFAQVTTDYDNTVDFTKFHTYTFKGWVEDSDKEMTEFDRKRIEEAFASELARRDLNLDNDNPDIAITLFIVVEEKTSLNAYTNYNGGMGYGHAYGWGMGMGNSTTTYTESDYTEGTLVIDFYDDSTKKLVWQGIMSGTVKQKAKKREKSIPKNVGKLMSKYPVSPSK